MSGGGKQLVFNTQERAVSSDVNRLQSFAGANMAEVFRYLMNVTGTDDLDAGSVITEYTTLGTPLRAEILNGLLVKPQVGVLDLLVDPGVMFALAPDAAPDDSNYKLVKDPGVASTGLLAMTANPSGSARIDVIEVQVSSVIVEVDSRDIFNPSTGTFVATSVTKARAATATFQGSASNIRVRAGVAGSGFPGTVSGWLPLAVASLPAGTTTNDTITFWDVRPLVSDRAIGLSGLMLSRPVISSVLVNCIAGATTAGLVEAVLGGRRIGGRLRSGSTVVDADSIDVTIAANQEASGVTFVSARPWYVYLLTPFGLPRWARYTVTAPRLPRSPRGMPVVSVTAPDSDGNPSAPIVLPATMGFNGASSAAGLAVVAGGTVPGPIRIGFWTDGLRTLLADAQTPGLGRPMEVAAAAFSVTAAVATARYNLTAGVNYPTNAREILCEFRADVDYGASVFGGTARQFLKIFGPNGGAQQTNYEIGGQIGTTVAVPPIASSTEANSWASVWVPLPPVYPATAAPTQRIEVDYDSGGFVNGVGSGGAHLRILGWRLG